MLSKDDFRIERTEYESGRAVFTLLQRVFVTGFLGWRAGYKWIPVRASYAYPQGLTPSSYGELDAPASAGVQPEQILVFPSLNAAQFAISRIIKHVSCVDMDNTVKSVTTLSAE